MISSSLNYSNYSFFDKLKSVDYFLILLVLLIGAVSVFSIYTFSLISSERITDEGTLLFS